MNAEVCSSSLCSDSDKLTGHFIIQRDETGRDKVSADVCVSKTYIQYLGYTNYIIVYQSLSSLTSKSHFISGEPESDHSPVCVSDCRCRWVWRDCSPSVLHSCRLCQHCGLVSVYLPPRICWRRSWQSWSQLYRWNCVCVHCISYTSF